MPGAGNAPVDREQLSLEEALEEEEKQLKEDNGGKEPAIEEAEELLTEWAQALDAVECEDVDHDFLDDELLASDDEDNETGLVPAAPEDAYESVIDGSLEPLPEANDPDYPQENRQYFQNKNYHVRCDKYTLASMVFGDGSVELGVEIPSLESIYKMHRVLSAFH